MKARRRWTAQEVEILEQRYKTVRRLSDLGRFLPGRTAAAIKGKITTLGLGRGKRGQRRIEANAPMKHWEKGLLVELGPRFSQVEIQAMVPHRTPQQVRQFAHELGVVFMDETDDWLAGQEGDDAD